VGFRLLVYPSAAAELSKLANDGGLVKRGKAVRKALGLLETNPRHPGLQTHKLQGMTCPHGNDLFEAYAENNRPGAYRITFCYPPGEQNVIVVVDIMVHP
jgi:hypothetical protein